MKMVMIQIDRQMARIGIESQRASLSIESKQRAMKVEHRNAEMSADRTSPRLELDVQDYFDHAGLCSPQTFCENNAAEAYAQAREGEKEAAADRDFVGTLTSPGNRIGELARQKTIEPNAPAMCTGEVPYGEIHMNGLPGKTNIHWSDSSMDIAWDRFIPPKIEVNPEASVKIRLAREPRLDITTVEKEIPPEM